jgi:hypothetical protein
MSIEVMTYVWKNSPSKSGRLLVLLALADRATDDGICWPGVNELARKARLGPRQVERALKELEQEGEIQRPPGKPTKESPYRIRQDDGPSPMTRPSSPMTGSSVAGDGTPIQEPPVESSKEPPRPINIVWAHYQTTIPGADKKRLTPKVERVIRAALEVREIPMLLKAISGLGASEHHRDGGWIAIEYAIGKVKKGESVEDRIDAMAAKAPLADAVGRGIDPVRVDRRLEEVRQNVSSGGFFEPGRAQKAREELKAWGFLLETLDRAPWVRLISAVNSPQVPQERQDGQEAA